MTLKERKEDKKRGKESNGKEGLLERFVLLNTNVS